MEHIIAILLEAFTKESNKFHLNKDEMVVSIKEICSTFIDNFDVPYERCAYMYRYSICHFYFLKDCMYDFFSGYESSKALEEVWGGWRPDPNFCSLSFGPGLDYLAFTSAILELDPKPSIIPSFKNIHILTQHGAWRNTVNLLSDAIWRARESKKINKNINFEELNVLQVNIFSNFKEDAVEILKNSDVVFMFKLLNWAAAPGGHEGHIRGTLNELASNIKAGAVVFFIDTMPSCCMMKEVLSEFKGTYLYGPVRVKYILPHEFPEELQKIWGKNPIKNAWGMFFVWKKYIPKSDFRQEGHSKLEITDHVSSLTQNIASINEKYIKEFSSSVRSSTSNLQNITPPAPENKGFNNRNFESKLGKEISEASSNKSKMKTIDYQESYNSTCSTKSSIECKEISSEDSNEKDLESIDKGLQIHQPLKESKYTQTDSVSDHQLSIIKSLTNKINHLASSVENNFELGNQMNRNEDSVAAKLNTIEHLTERINRLINSLELVLSNQTVYDKCEEMFCDDLAL